MKKHKFDSLLTSISFHWSSVLATYDEPCVCLTSYIDGVQAGVSGSTTKAQREELMFLWSLAVCLA